jgi:hypothetical protein
VKMTPNFEVAHRSHPRARKCGSNRKRLLSHPIVGKIKGNLLNYCNVF